MSLYRVVTESYAYFQRSIIRLDLTSPPGTPARGDRYIVGPASTGSWSGHDNDIAWYDGIQWLFDTPREGWQVYDVLQSIYLYFNGTIWTQPPGAVDEKVKADTGDSTPGYLSNKVDDSTIEVNNTAHNLRVKANGINTNELALTSVDNTIINDNIAGEGLLRNGSTGALDINDDDSSLTIIGDILQVKSGGITDTMLANDYIYADGTRSFTGNISLGGFHITNLASPIYGTDAANKNYIDSLLTGITWRKPVIAILNTPVSSPNDGDRYLVDDSPTGDYVGHENDIAVYDLGTTSWVFTNPVANWALFTKDIDAAYTYDDASSETFKWIQFTGAGQINAGDGLVKSGNTLNVNVDSTSIEIIADQLQVKNDGITAAKLNTDTAGAGLVQNSSTGALDVNPDDTSIEITSDVLNIKNDGVTAAKLNVDTAGDGLVQNSSTGALDVNPDDTTIEINSDQIRLKDDGVSATKLNADTAGLGLSQAGTGALDVNVDNVTTQINSSDQVELHPTLKSNYDIAYTRRAQWDSQLEAIIFDI